MKATYPPTPHKRWTPPHSRLYTLGVILCALNATLVPCTVFAQGATPDAPRNPDQTQGNTFAGTFYLPWIAIGISSQYGAVKVDVTTAESPNSTLDSAAYIVFGTAPEVPPINPDLPDANTHRLLLPFISYPYERVYRDVPAIPVADAPPDRPAAISGDLNLALRGYAPTDSAMMLIDVGGETDGDPPQLSALFRPVRPALIIQNYSVYDWNWACSEHGCRGALIDSPTVTMFALAATPNEAVYLPSRHTEIYGGDFKALVLYADDTRITLKYTREDSPVFGYMLHLEDLLVDPSIILRYRELDAAGRGHLPALRNGDLVGYAYGDSVKVAMRDTGSFMDPRVRKDWWQGW